MCDIGERAVKRFPLPMLDVSEDAYSIASLTRLLYLEICLYVVCCLPFLVNTP